MKKALMNDFFKFVGLAVDKAKLSSQGPGTELKNLLSRIGIKSSPNCSCNDRAQIMNRNGVEWCEQNIETICDWLAEESAKRRIPFVRTAARMMIKLSIRNFKSKSKSLLGQSINNNSFVDYEDFMEISPNKIYACNFLDLESINYTFDKNNNLYKDLNGIYTIVYEDKIWKFKIKNKELYFAYDLFDSWYFSDNSTSGHNRGDISYGIISDYSCEDSNYKEGAISDFSFEKLKINLDNKFKISQVLENQNSKDDYEDDYNNDNLLRSMSLLVYEESQDPSITGTVYVGFLQSTNKLKKLYPELGFTSYQVENYKISSIIIKSGGLFDDFGEVENIKFHNNLDCSIDGPSKTTIILQDTELTNNISFIKFENSNYYYIPINYSVFSSNCGPPTIMNLKININFEKIKNQTS